MLTDINDTEVSEELKRIGYNVLSVRKFGYASKNLHIHMVTLPNTYLSKLIVKVTSLFCVANKVEKSSKTTVQHDAFPAVFSTPVCITPML